MVFRALECTNPAALILHAARLQVHADECCSLMPHIHCLGSGVHNANVQLPAYVVKLVGAGCLENSYR